MQSFHLRCSHTSPDPNPALRSNLGCGFTDISDDLLSTGPLRDNSESQIQTKDEMLSGTAWCNLNRIWHAFKINFEEFELSQTKVIMELRVSHHKVGCHRWPGYRKITGTKELSNRLEVAFHLSGMSGHLDFFSLRSCHALGICFIRQRGTVSLAKRS